MINRRSPKRRKPAEDETIEIHQLVPNRVGYHAPPWTPASEQLLADWHYGMKRAMALGNAASEKWAERSNWLNAYCDTRGMSPTQRAKFRQGDLWLTDAFEEWSFFEREVRRYGDMIQAELNMRLLHNGGGQ